MVPQGTAFAQPAPFDCGTMPLRLRSWEPGVLYFVVVGGGGSLRSRGLRGSWKHLVGKATVLGYKRLECLRVHLGEAALNVGEVPVGVAARV